MVNTTTMSSSTSAFSFNFHISDDTNTCTTTLSSPIAPSQGEQQPSSAVLDHNEHDSVLEQQAMRQQDRIVTNEMMTETKINRIPFHWVDHMYMKAILLERSQEELTYTDIGLSYDDQIVNENTKRHYSTENNHTDDTTHEVGAAESTATTEQNDQQPELSHFSSIRCVDLTVSSYRTSAERINETETTTNDDSDIIPGIYEGGRKVWECCRDLIQYLHHNNISLHNLNGNMNHNTFQSERNNFDQPKKLFALELGCGHGLPGCYLLSQAIQYQQRHRKAMPTEPCIDYSVVFTDYNESVLLDATISNIILNTVGEMCDETNHDSAITTTSDLIDTVAAHIALGGGDWLDMSHQMQCTNARSDSIIESSAKDDTTIKIPNDGYFDVIVASETIYTISAAQEMVILLQNHLRPETGVAYIASKRYYFGVGGGVDIFCNLCNTQNSSSTVKIQLHVDVVKIIDNGVGNIREILRVQSRYT